MTQPRLALAHRLMDGGSLSAAEAAIADILAAVNGGAKLVHPGGAKLVHLTLCGTRCWGVVPVVHESDPISLDTELA